MKKLSEYLEKIRSLPPHEIAKKALHKIKNKITSSSSKLAVRLLGTSIPDGQFLRKIKVPERRIRSAEELKTHFLSRKEPRFFTDAAFHDLASILHAGKILPEADKVCAHIFDLLGSGDIQLGDPINWHCDFKTGFQWNPNTFYKEITIPYGEADIKVPWELSRFQHAPLLGLAYRITKDERYSEEFIGQVTDWIGQNRLKFGVNWACTMDVAIRACSWGAALTLLKDSPRLESDFMIRFLKSLYLHGCHIRRNLEIGCGTTSNHYLSDLAGLVFLGVLFPEFDDAEEWKELGIRELVKEMEKQVRPDGTDYEASTCYHRLVLELFFFSTLIVVINDPRFSGNNHKAISEQIFGADYTEKLYGLFDAVSALVKPDGRMPQIGDNDSGRFFKLYPRNGLDMRYLLALGAVFFKESRWKIREFFESPEDIAELLLAYGGKGREIWDSLEWNALSALESRAFHDSGWHVMRNESTYCLASCGPNGLDGHGGHTHNDKLSFVLSRDGKDIMIDSGTGVYTSFPAQRNMFRSTSSHNTVAVDGEEQNQINETDWHLFRIGNEAQPKVIDWQPGKETDVLIGEHYGYQRLENPVTHRREFRFDKNEGQLEITDTFAGSGRHQLEWNLILAPDLDEPPKVISDKLRFELKPAVYSPEYGAIVETKKLHAMVEAEVPAEFSFIILF